MAEYFLNQSASYKAKTDASLYRRREVVCEYLSDEYLLGAYNKVDTFRLVHRKLAKEGIDINMSLFDLDKAFLRTIYLWVINTPKDLITDPQLLPKQGLAGARCLLEDGLTRWKNDTVVKADPVVKAPVQVTISEPKQETVALPSPPIAEPIKVETSNAVVSEFSVATTNGNSSNSSPQNLVEVRGKAVLIKKEHITQRFGHATEQPKTGQTVKKPHNVSNSGVVVRKLEPVRPPVPSSVFGDKLKSASENPISSITSPVVPAPSPKGVVTTVLAHESNKVIEQVSVFGFDTGLGSEFDAGLKKIISLLQSETSRIVKEHKQALADLEHFRREKQELTELLRLSEHERLNPPPLPPEPEANEYITLLEKENEALELLVSDLKAKLESTDAADILEIAKNYPQFPVLFTVAQEIKALQNDRKSKYEALQSKLPKSFSWGDQKGTVVYKQSFLKDLAAFNRKEQASVASQIETLTLRGPDAPSLSSTKYIAQLPHSPAGCMVSRSGELRFSWKRIESLTFFGVFRVSDTRLKNMES